MSRQLTVQPLPALANLRPPKSRDLEIYKKVKIQLREQWEVAHDFNLHYSRVSQIVKRVGRWLAAGGSPTDPELRDYAARQRLSRATHQPRLERAVELASCAMEASPPPLRTKRRRVVGGSEVWREEVDRDQPAYNLSAIRLLLRATDSLREWEGQGGEEKEPPSDQDLLQMVFEMLCRWRQRAEKEGRIGPCGDIPGCVAAALNMLLRAELPTRLSKEAMLNSISNDNAQVALNLSAPPLEPKHETNDAATLCADSTGTAQEKTCELERRAGGKSPADCTAVGQNW